jgi:hypothetical protein
MPCTFAQAQHTARAARVYMAWKAVIECRARTKRPNPQAQPHASHICAGTTHSPCCACVRGRESSRSGVVQNGHPIPTPLHHHHASYICTGTAHSPCCACVRGMKSMSSRRWGLAGAAEKTRHRLLPPPRTPKSKTPPLGFEPETKNGVTNARIQQITHTTGAPCDEV